MTPHQLARLECANLRPNGTCVWIEPPSWHDYRVPPPEWLTVRQWDAFVAAAIERGDPMPKADRRTGEQLDTTQPHANPYRQDFYYCHDWDCRDCRRDCGCRMGVIGERCLDCRGVPFVPDDVDRRCKVTRGQRCNYFEKVILPLADQAPPESEPNLQRRRAQARQAYLDNHNLPGAKAARKCPDCGEPLAKGKQVCPKCRKRRRRKTYRGSRNRSRPDGRHNSLPDKD
jgi:hypothetical protein